MTNPSSYDPDEGVTAHDMATVTLVGDYYTLSTCVLIPRNEDGTFAADPEEIAISFIEGYYGWKVRDTVIDVLMEEDL